MPEAIALPDIALLLYALMLMLVAAALSVIIYILVNWLSHFPVIGGAIARTGAELLTQARDGALHRARNGFDAAGRLLEWAWHWWARFTIAEWEWALRVTQGVHHLATVSVPQAIVHAERSALDYVRAAEVLAAAGLRALDRAVVSAFDRVEARVTAVTAELTAEAIRLWRDGRAFTVREIAAAERWAAAELARASTVLRAELVALAAAVAADVRAVERYAASLFDRAEQDIANAEAAAQRYAEAAVADQARVIYTDLETWGVQAVQDAWPDAEQELAHLGRTLGADFPWLKDLLGALGGLGVAGLAGTLIRSMATSQALTRLADDCIVPQCRNLGGLSSDLANLSALFAAGTFFAWVAEGVASPDGWAQDVASVLGPIGATAAAEARTTFGVG